MVKNSKQQTERLVYRLGLRNSNSAQNGGIHPSSSSPPYSSNDLDKEGYNAPFIPKSTSYVDYTKQYFSKSDASKSSANVDALSTHQRSVTSTSPIVATYDYSPFGQLIATSGTPELSPIQFSSEVFDPETALTYYNHRYYNPTDGRWLARDPAEEFASLNLYAFVNNAPNYRADYLGLISSHGNPETCPIRKISLIFIDNNFPMSEKATIYFANRFHPMQAVFLAKLLFTSSSIPINNLDELVSNSENRCKEYSCIEKIKLYAHGAYLQWAGISVGNIQYTENDDKQISSPFLKLTPKFCSPCEIEIVSCSIGLSKQLRTELAKTKCKIILYDTEVSAYA